MFPYQKFLIKETDRFDPSIFPQLDESLEQTVLQLATTPNAPSAAMIVSFAKDHRPAALQTADSPQFAWQLSAKSLPLTVLKNLFDSSKQNPGYRDALEAYATAYLTTGKTPQAVF
jgi:hypothetical protein